MRLEKYWQFFFSSSFFEVTFFQDCKQARESEFNCPRWNQNVNKIVKARNNHHFYLPLGSSSVNVSVAFVDLFIT